MTAQERTAKRWKFLLLIGRPIALFGIILVPIGIISADPALVMVGIALLVFGFLAAWTGKLGAYWFHG